MKHLCTAFALFVLTACTGAEQRGESVAVQPAPTIATDPVPARIDSLRRASRPGDLLLRLGDDMMSYSIRYLSESDPSYSHVGLLIQRKGELQVAHIGPYPNGGDTLRYEPIDSFINPATNLEAGLYRFRISEAERERFLNNVQAWGRKGVHFDYAYDLRTDGQLYCTELIAKSLAPATANRIHFSGMQVPASMRKLMYAFLSQTVPDTAEVRSRRYIALDQLYRSAYCDSILKIQLRNQ
ncbi:MAG: hypothetical protein EOO08_04660 [Chitinophagaceae bacterium]|nr:MAG: hypothetical protein EOO08_04660 [Chitinophagaceae bacterium]